jgi:resolvase-like protein
MSTDFQRYSIQNQAAAIAAYAQQKNLTIVRIYVDEGRSGLRLKGRAGLIELLDDVRSGHTDFGHVLVYNVVDGDAFRMSMKAHTTSLSASKMVSRSPIARGNLITMEASFRASSRTSSV